MTDYRQFDDRCETLAKVKRLNVKQLAALLGINRQHLYHLRRGTRNITGDSWRALEQAELEASISARSEHPLLLDVPMGRKPTAAHTARRAEQALAEAANQVRAALEDLAILRHADDPAACELAMDALNSSLDEALRWAYVRGSTNRKAKFTPGAEGLEEPDERAAAEYAGLRLKDREQPNAKDRELADCWRMKHPNPGNYLHADLVEFLRPQLSADGRHVLNLLVSAGYHFNLDAPVNTEQQVKDYLGMIIDRAKGKPGMIESVMSSLTKALPLEEFEDQPIDRDAVAQAKQQAKERAEAQQHFRSEGEKDAKAE